MENNQHREKVTTVFTDVGAHRFTADIIKRHSTNQNDIRRIALQGIDLSWCKTIFELGCGFGFFTEALRGKVHPEAVITGVDLVSEYESHFLEACSTAGVRGEFCSRGVSLLKDVRDRSVDLIICSFSLYFFPEVIPDIARVLHDRGVLVATVHNENNMEELIGFAKEILGESGMIHGDEKLPIEVFIKGFSSQSGYRLLAPWFRKITVREFINTLVFEPGDMYCLMEYFRFKWPFFLSAASHEMEPVFDLIEANLQKSYSNRLKSFTISKDDTIFVCAQPLPEKNAP
ncbi:MAG: class I SAM-dependent methyltransferase [Deltaproteobacteria bacterium]|nr:class I SAM-dependent methyltransferase [Deltaproteobacteria bacterium]